MYAGKYNKMYKFLESQHLLMFAGLVLSDCVYKTAAKADTAAILFLRSDAALLPYMSIIRCIWVKW